MSDEMCPNPVTCPFVDSTEPHPVSDHPGMSEDRRPENRVEVRVESSPNSSFDVQVLPADLIAAVRRGVESGTIKGEVIWRCGEGSGHEDGWFCDRAVPTDQLGPNCGYRLLIPVSDGGSET